MVCGWDIIISTRRGHFKSELWSYNSASHFLYSNEMCKQNECLLLQHNSNNVVILDANHPPWQYFLCHGPLEFTQPEMQQMICDEEGPVFIICSPDYSVFVVSQVTPIPLFAFHYLRHHSLLIITGWRDWRRLVCAPYVWACRGGPKEIKWRCERNDKWTLPVTECL